MLFVNSHYYITEVLCGGWVGGQTDYNIGQIVQKLDATGDLKMETAVIVFGDHGTRRRSSLLNWQRSLPSCADSRCR